MSSMFEKGMMRGARRERDRLRTEMKFYLFNMMGESDEVRDFLNPVVKAVMKFSGWFGMIGQVIRDWSPQQYIDRALKAIRLLSDILLDRLGFAYSLERSEVPPREYLHEMDNYDNLMSTTIGVCVSILRHMETVIPSRMYDQYVASDLEKHASETQERIQEAKKSDGKIKSKTFIKRKTSPNEFDHEEGIPVVEY